jgi:hypothetical protein
MSEEGLDEILCVLGCVSPVTQKGIERRPIRLAKSGQRLLRRSIRFALSRSQDDRPIRRLKRSTPSCKVPGTAFMITEDRKKLWVDDTIE